VAFPIVSLWLPGLMRWIVPSGRSRGRGRLC